MLMRFFNYILNRLPFFKKIDGHKTRIAGVLIAIATVVVTLAPFIPTPYDAFALAVADLIQQVAGVLGTVGVAGILAKKWDVPKFPSKEKPETPELIKK
jgi:hypothetical protein